MSSTQRRPGAPADEDKLNVRIFIDGSDQDGIRYFDEALPVSTVRALLDPLSPAFFVSVQSPSRLKPATVKRHMINSRYIRELMLFDDLPEEERQIPL